MRIQHNILSMNAYRNYGNNTSALGKNLEKLSSGYKINRAGDDAAGLAISEKMRAQIKGLDAAQKNVKDAVSFVKTAEGAMQEIQDMLSRMKYLATQSANGTYENDVDRENLQLEVDALIDEIDRIAENANFNGIHMLRGGGAAAGSTGSGGTQAGTANANAGIMLTANPGIAMAALKPSTGSGATATASVAVSSDPGDVFASNSTKTGASLAGKTMTVSFTGSKTTANVKIAFGTASSAGSTSDAQIYVQIATTDSASAAFTKLQNAVTAYGNGLAAQNTAKGTAGSYLSGITVARDSSGLKFNGTFTQYEVDNTQSTGSGSTAKVATGQTVGVDFSKVTTNFKNGDKVVIGDVEYAFSSSTGVAAAAANTVTVQLGSTVEKTLANLAKAIDDQKATTGVGATYDATAKKLTLTTTKEMTVDEFKDALDIDTTGITDAATKAAVEEAWDAGVQEVIDKLAGGDEYSITMQIGDTAGEQLQLKIGSMKTDGKMNVKGLDISQPDAANKSIDQVRDAINYVSSVRGQLGAYQNRLEHTANNLSVMAENIQDAESTIRDTDVADEMMAYTKNNILIQSAQAMLAQANAVPQGVLQLLQ